MTGQMARFGRGWAFPVIPDETTKLLPFVQGPEKVRQAIRIILETEPGERIMRSRFGCGLQRYLMQLNTVATRTLIQRDVEQALATWEPRIRIERVSVDPGDNPSLVQITIAFSHVVDGRRDNLVHPFYLE